MSAASKTKELLDVLSAACARQFNFNPRRVNEDMRYVGKETAGKDIVHVFRDVSTHSQIVLRGTFATLRESQGEKPHWSAAEQAHYKCSDAEMEAEVAAKQAELDYTHSSAFYQAHKEHLLSHYKESPAYKEGMPSMHAAAKALIATLSESQDAQLTAFAAKTLNKDADHLTHLLLASCHLDIEANKLA